MIRQSLTRLAGRIIRNRSKLPVWINQLLDAPARNPDGLFGRLVLGVLSGGDAPHTTVPAAATRVYIGPTNYSGQAYQWARALEREDPTIAARNIEIGLPGGYAFPADTMVPIAVNSGSAVWQQEEWESARRFSHVLFEAERPILGSLFARDVESEATAFEAAGASVAFMCHGTDIRDPRRHAERTPWSPYPEDPRTPVLQQDAEQNLALLERLRRPTFVSTPDLLFDVPWATWCPVVVDESRFANDVPVLSGAPARIIHSSSSPVQKGSHHIEPALAPLIDAGRVEYTLVSGVSSARMPEVLADSDIVLDQFRLGSYGVAACEAMAAGRVVIGHVLPDVRADIRRITGLDVPIIEAAPDSLSTVVEDILQTPDRARQVARDGIDYVRAVHSGSFSARVLTHGWIRPASQEN